MGKDLPRVVVDPNIHALLRCSALRARFLLECVRDLDAGLRERGSRLYVVSGDPVEVLPALWEKWGVTHVTHEADKTGEPYATERDAAVRGAARGAGVTVEEFQSETLRPLGDVPGGYVANVGGVASNVPGTMSAFQKLLGRIKRGSIPLPLDTPRKGDFPPSEDDDSDEYLPLEHPWEIPWPRGYGKDEIGPVWDRKDCTDETLRPIAVGGESRALERLRKTVTARPDWSVPCVPCDATRAATVVPNTKSN